MRQHIQDEVRVRIVDRGSRVIILGEEEAVSVAENDLSQMLAAVRGGYTPTISDVRYVLQEVRERATQRFETLVSERSPVVRADIAVRPRTHGQKHYLETIATHDLTLVIGPAGTGKTYLAMAAAVSALMNRQVRRLILTRPAVEAGENLGFLPGGLEEKVNPYLRPLYDALYSMVDVDRIRRFIEQQQIEVAPLAFMRGRTLDQAFVILDEAQNTTTDQMMMFLTRLGQGSRAVVTGDITQIDLPKTVKSGLVEARRILQNVPGIGIVYMSKRDVVRNPLVQRIIDSYEADKARADMEKSGRDSQ